MGRIAYLSKRGNIWWWFRRRHPVIVIPVPLNTQVSGTCGNLGRKAQAKGHLAVSLQTSSSRKARQLGARLSAHFEAAWGEAEVRLSDRQDQEDMLDHMASMMTEGFRKFIEHYRATGMAGMAPAIRERAFARLDAELREALGIAPLPYAEMLTRVEIRPSIKYIAFHAPDPYAPLSAEEELFERLALDTSEDGSIEQQVAHTEGFYAKSLNPSDFQMLDAEDENTGARLEAMVDGMGRLLDDYFAACQKSGRDPRTEIPAARQIAETLGQAARRLGLPEVSEKHRKPEPRQPEVEYSTEAFTDFARRYLGSRLR